MTNEQLEKNNEWLRECIEEYQKAFENLKKWIKEEKEYASDSNYQNLSELEENVDYFDPKIKIEHSQKHKKENGDYKFLSSQRIKELVQKELQKK